MEVTAHYSSHMQLSVRDEEKKEKKKQTTTLMQRYERKKLNLGLWQVGFLLVKTKMDSTFLLLSVYFWSSF